MSLVTVKPKFQVTIPAKLRGHIDLHEGDVLDAVLVKDGILLRPKAVVDRALAAGRVEAAFASAEPSAEDARRSEDEIVRDTTGEIAKARAVGHSHPAPSSTA